MKIYKSTKVTLCPLCGETKFTDLGESKCPILDKRFHLEKCNNCGLVFVNPSPNEKELSKIYSTEYRIGYQSWVGKILNVYNSVVFAADARFIRRYIKKGKIIDIGYGSGKMLSALGSGWEKYGYDAYSKKSDRKDIEKRLGIKTLSSLKSLKTQSFDLVILRNVVEHTMKFNDLFGAAHRILKPGGLLFIRTPNIGSIDFRIFGPSWYMTYMGGHLVFFDKLNLRKVAEMSGFKPLIVKTTESSPILSLQRNLQLKFSISNRLILLLLVPVSVIYSLGSYFFRNGNDILAIFKRTLAA